MRSSAHRSLRAEPRCMPSRLAAAMAAASLLTLAVGPASAQTAAQAQVLPSGLSVAAGRAQVSTSGSRMTVTNSSQAILNWNSFSIGAGNAVHFQQPDTRSQVLNRVTGSDPSQIFGSLSSNGRVWLLNPNGVLFGQTARVDVAGLVASTLRINDVDWLAGRYRFQDGGAAQAGVVNQGELRTSFGGTLALVGGSVGNDGLMLAPGGQAILAAGSSVELVDTGAANLSVRIAAPAGEARNLGLIDAAGGRIDIHAAAVNQRGIVRADALGSGPGGEVWIRASERATVQGDVSATGGSAGHGGQVVVLGREVGIQDDARIDVSGGSGGGSVVIGGGAQGRDARYPNAEAVYVGPRTQIVADAVQRGDGGDIVLWSDHATRAYGTLSARGGATGGNGGHIETSGGWLDAQPARIDTAAPAGTAGSWLLDPYDILVSDFTSTSSNFGAGPTFVANASNSTISTSTIVSALASANVTISTGGVNGGNENGNITLSNATIVTNLAAARSLTLLADGLIDIDQSTIRSNNGALTVNLLSAQTRNGGISVSDSSVTTGSGSTYGDLTLGGSKSGTLPSGAAFNGAAGGAAPYGVLLTGATLNAGSGTLTLLGAVTNGGASGVVITDSSVTARTLTIAGDGPTGVGVDFGGTSFVRATQTASVNGRGQVNGVRLAQDAQLSVLPPSTDTSASLIITGQSRTPSGGTGVLINSTGSRTYSVLTGRGASMTIVGDSTSGDTSPAVYITSSNGPIPGFPAVDASGGDSGGGRSLTIATSGAARDIEINDALVVTGTGSTIIRAGGGTSSNVSMFASNMTLLGTTLIAGQDITIGSSSAITAGAPLALTISAARNLQITSTQITAGGGPVAITLQAGDASGGSLQVNASTIASGNGAIVIGGAGTGTTPTGTAFSGVGNGASFGSSTLDAGSGAITIAGVSTGSGDAVNLLDSDLAGRSITILGDAPLGNGGIVLDSFSSIDATHDLTLRGRGLGYGVLITPGSQAIVLPAAQDASAAGLIQGRALATNGLGVRIGGDNGATALLASNGASLTLEAASASSADAMQLSGGFGGPLVVDARGGGTLTLRTFDNGTNLSVTNTTVFGGAGLLTLQAANTLALANSTLSANGAVALTASRVALASGGPLQVQSQATGDAIVIAGPGGSPLAGFSNAAGASVLSAPNGRWIVYGTNVNDTSNFVPGALPYAFKRYNSVYGGWAADVGNGLVFRTPQSAVYTGTVQTRAYDGTATAVLSNASIASISVPGDTGVRQPSTVRFLTIDAGTGLAAAFDNPQPYTFVDSNSRPVYGYSVSGSLSGTITPRPISATVTASKVYDATTTAVASIGTLANLVGSETVLVGGSGSYNNKNAGSNKPLTLSYTLQDGANGGKAGNYSFAPSATPVGTITPRPLALSGVTAADKVYDATSNATLAGTPTVTPLAGDSVTVAGSPSASFANKNVGSAKAVSVGGYTLGGTDGANYTATQPTGLTASITPRPLVIGGVAAASKVYDATTAATLTGSAAATPLAGDAVTVAGTPSASFANKNVGSNKSVAVAGYVFGGTDGANYTPVQPSGLTATISPRSVGVTGVTALDKVYDATTAATLGSGASVATLPGDAVTLGGAPSGSFSDKNVGSSKTVSIVGGYTLGGADAGNYTLVQPLSATASITPRPVSLTGVAVADKVYDATTAASFSGTASVTPLAGDSLSVAGTPAASFADKNAGVAKPVVVSGYALGGADAGNYTLGATGGLTASITPRPATIGGVSAAGKVYDATTAATLSGTATVTPLAGDALGVIGTPSASFADKNAGSNKSVAVAGYAFGGADAGNYTAVQPTGLRASIAPRPVAVVGISAVDKVYDATTAATLTGSASVGTLAGDTVTLAGTPVASFADKNVGLDKAVTTAGYALGGTDAANYTLSQPTGLVADITPRALSIAGLSAANKVYDATTAATISGGGSIAPLAGDSVTIAGTPTASFADKNAGVAKPVLVAGYALGGADAGNYSIGQPTGLVADITPRPATIGGVSAASKVYDATTAVTLAGSATVTPLPGDALSVTGSPSASFGDKNVGSNKSVAVTGYAFGGADAANYTAVQPGGLRASITPLALTVTGIAAADKVYDATAAATLTGTASVGALAGDAVTLAGTPVATFADKNVGLDKSVAAGGYVLGGTDAANYALSQPAGLLADITPRPATIGGIAVVAKVYDATTAAALSGSATAATLAGDAVSVAGTPSASFDNKNAGSNKSVSVTGYTLAGADAANYTLPGAQALAGNITPRPLAVTGVAADAKVYDGSSAARLSGSAAVAALPGDSVQLTGTASAAFADRNVGNAKPVAVSGYGVSGSDAANYALAQPQNLTAAIAPASLTYVADPAVRSVGQAISDLQGSVTGFIGGETLLGATSGTLAFTSPAAAGAPVGSYPIQGTGLAAQNYVFAQAPGNAAALSIVDLTPNTTTIVDAVDSAQQASASIATILAVTRPLSVESGLANLTVVSVGTAGNNAVKPVSDFKPVRLASLSAADLQSLLAGRDLFKKALLADAVQRLQDDPRLADLRECRSVAEAQSGGCLITEELKAQVQQPAAAAPAAAPAFPGAVAPGAPAAAVPGVPDTATSPPAAPTSPISPPGAMPAPVPPIQSTAPSSADVDPLLREVLQIRRRVVNAALPQIERKIALVIGIDTYADKSIPQLGNAVRDARSVARVFETRLGYEAVVLDNATRATLVAALNRLALTVGPRDSVVIYYAGHGELVESTRLGYWLLSDSVAKTPETWLSNTDISRLIGQMGASQVALISDSCYSGSLGSEERIRATPSTLDPQAVLARKSVVVMSSGGNEPVFDEGRDGHSPFAWNLMNTLGKVADWQAGGNVFERVRFAVAREVPQRPQYSASRAAGHQAGGDYLFEQRQLDAGK